MTGDAVSASCRMTYRAYRKSGSRPLSAIDWIVLHSTEVKADSKKPVSTTNVASASLIARSFTNTTAGGSAHLVIDDGSCYRCLLNSEVPWAAPSANYRGFHIEQCAFAEWTLQQWLKHESMLDRVAYKIAYHAHFFGLPIIFVDAGGLKKDYKGVTTHAEVSKAFPNRQGNHHDPGVNYPMEYVIAQARQYLEEIRNS